MSCPYLHSLRSIWRAVRARPGNHGSGGGAIANVTYLEGALLLDAVLTLFTTSKCTRASCLFLNRHLSFASVVPACGFGNKPRTRTESSAEEGALGTFS